MLLQNYFHLIVLAFRKTTWKLEGSKEMKAQPPLHMYENGENKADVHTLGCKMFGLGQKVLSRLA